jgi:hypothetical protein
VIAMTAALVVERTGRDRGGTPTPGLPPGPRSILDGIDDRVAHDGSWILVGLTVAAFIVAAVPLGVLGGWRDLLLAVLLAAPLTMSATAATPIAAALVVAGMSPGTAIAAVLLGSMLNLTTVTFLRRTWSAVAAVAAAATAVTIAVAVALAVDAAGIHADPIATSHGILPAICLAILGALAAASQWRHGLAHWLAALRGTDHGHEHGRADVEGHCDHHHHDDEHA